MSRPLLSAPPNWRKGTLAPQAGGLITRVSSGGTPATSIDEYWDGDVLWLTPKELARGSAGLFVTDTERKISELGLRSSGATLLPVGTVMLTKRAPVGLVGIATVPLTTNQGFLNFVCGDGLVPAYLAYWLLANRPYLDAVATLEDAGHLMAILKAEELLDKDEWNRRGIVAGSKTQCPLCLGRLRYAEYHETLALESEGGLENAGAQVEGATRSTKINLFHLRPLFYKALVHVPTNIGWGHAVCNTRLGQRPCYSVAELEEDGKAITLVGDDGCPRKGRMSMDGVMIRSNHGGVWIEIVREGEVGEEATTEAVVDEASVSE